MEEGAQRKRERIALSRRSGRSNSQRGTNQRGWWRGPREKTGVNKANNLRGKEKKAAPTGWECEEFGII